MLVTSLLLLAVMLLIFAAFVSAMAKVFGQFFEAVAGLFGWLFKSKLRIAALLLVLAAIWCAANGL